MYKSWCKARMVAYTFWVSKLLQMSIGAFDTTFRGINIIKEESTTFPLVISAFNILYPPPRKNALSLAAGQQYYNISVCIR